MLKRISHLMLGIGAVGFLSWSGATIGAVSWHSPEFTDVTVPISWIIWFVVSMALFVGGIALQYIVEG